ncbi:MAG: ATP-binding protein, partial [Pseudomonadota bacterium]
NALSEQLEIQEELANIYEALGRDSDALAALRRAHEIEEEIDYPGAAKRIKELEAARRLAENELALARQSQRQRLLLIAAAFLVLLAVSLTAYARSRGRLLSQVQRTALELSDSEQRYRSLFNDTSEPRMLIDLEVGRVIDANEPAAALCGRPVAAILGQDLTELQPEWLSRALLRGEEASHSPIGVHESWFTPSGEEEFADVWIAPVPLQGRRCALVAIHDTTVNRREEEDRIRRGQLESLGVLAGGIAHDFNNALSVVLGYVTLARTHLDEKSGTARLLGSAERSIDHAAKLSSNLLTFSKGGEPRRERHDIGLRVTEAAQVATAGSGVELKLSTGADLWDADVDLGQLNQLISNLIRNAIQAMDERGVLTVEAHNHLAVEPLSPSVKAGNFVQIDVTDSGPGIPTTIQGKVLNPYFSTTPGHAGLGLATAFAIATRHGGWLTFKSSEGRGTTFSVYLPASVEGKSGTAAEGRKSVKDQESVLVMDDDQAIQRMYSRVLNQLGYQAEITGEGSAAVKRYREAFEEGAPFDVVVMDLTVPGGMGGKDALAEIQRFDPAVRAVVASGYSNDPVMANYEESGFRAALHKPFSLQALSTLLREVLDERTSKTQAGSRPKTQTRKRI